MSEVRKLMAADVDQLVSVARDIFFKTFLDNNNPNDVYEYVDKHLSKESFLREINDPNYFTSGFYIEGVLVAYTQMYINKKETYDGIEFELKRFYLKQDHHGKGLAKTMMKHCEELAQTQKYNAIWLGVWEKNFRAQKFYEKMGFVKTSSHEFIMGNDKQTDLIYTKKLNQSQK